jgi:peptide-methionine (S)-S-oxide reductase
MDRRIIAQKERTLMERAVFGASEFFSQKAFITDFRGIEYIQIKQLKEKNVDIVEIWFDPWKVSYNELLDLFFDLHNPTIKNGQEYKNQSYIFFTNFSQLKIAKQKKNQLIQVFKDEMITEIIPVFEHNDTGKDIKLIS